MNDYLIISAPNAEELMAEVKKAINNGWQPLGGVSPNTSFRWFSWKVVVTFYQAMVK